MAIKGEHSLRACVLISVVIKPRSGVIYAPYMMRDAVKERCGAASLLVWIDVWKVESLYLYKNREAMGRLG